MKDVQFITENKIKLKRINKNVQGIKQKQIKELRNSINENDTFEKERKEQIRRQIFIATIEESFSYLKKNVHFYKPNSIVEAPIKRFFTELF